jgi:hypothetical protein
MKDIKSHHNHGYMGNKLYIDDYILNNDENKPVYKDAFQTKIGFEELLRN